MGQGPFWMWAVLFCRLVVRNGTKGEYQCRHSPCFLLAWIPSYTWIATDSPEVLGANHPMTRASEPMSRSTLFPPLGFFSHRYLVRTIRKVINPFTVCLIQWPKCLWNMLPLECSYSISLIDSSVSALAGTGELKVLEDPLFGSSNTHNSRRRVWVQSESLRICSLWM